MNKKEVKKILDQREDITCDCKRKKSNTKNRIKYGTCDCDTFSLCHTLGLVMANSLFQYIKCAKQIIIRDDWGVIEKHAKAIKEYATSDSWLKHSDEKDKKGISLSILQDKKEIAWRKAMFWLQENWQSLWW